MKDSNKIMTTRELAEYIKLNEKTVIKMAQNGKLPGVKIGNQWRFHLPAVDHRLQKGIMESPKNDLDVLIHTAEDIIPLSRLTDVSLIHLNLRAKDKKDVLAELSEVAAKSNLTPSAQELFGCLKEREKMLSTAVGGGIALPHPRNPSTTLFKNPNLIIGRSTKGVNFLAPDTKKVRLFFMPCAPNEFVHLRLLAKISKLLQTPQRIKEFLAAESPEKVIKILLEFERREVGLFLKEH